MDATIRCKLKPDQHNEGELAVRLLAQHEQEVSWLKRELHDNLGQFLFTIGMNVKWACDHCPQEQTSLLARLQETLQLVEEAVQASRHLSSTLRSDALNWGSLGLEERLSEYAATLEEHTHIPIQFSSLLYEEEALEPETASHLYHIVREALDNATRHAQATTVKVTLDRIGRELLLSIEDNGKGFDLAAQLSAQTVGLEAMFARTRLIGGELDIHTTPGGGATIRLHAPVVTKGESKP